MPVPGRFYTGADHHADTYRAFEADVADVLADVDPTDPRARRRLRRLANDIDREADQLADRTRSWLNTTLPAVWAAGATEHHVGTFTWTDQHRAALTLLIEDTVTEVAAAAAGMSGDVRAAAGAGRGAGPARRRLTVTGITARTYADGRHIRASTYVATVLATKVTVAHNLGALNQYRAAGVDTATVVDGPGCGLTAHDDPLDAHGLTVTVDTGAAYPLSHPGCRRSFTPAPPGHTPAPASAGGTGSLFARYLIAQPTPPPAATAGPGPAVRVERTARTARASRAARTARRTRQGANP